jgi:hypothetical protein
MTKWMKSNYYNVRMRELNTWYSQAKIDETGDIDAGKTILKKLDNLDKESGIPQVRKIGGCRITKTETPVK